MEIFSFQEHKEHVLAEVDARVKMLMGIILLAMVLSYKGYVFPAVVAASCMALCIVMRVPPRKLLHRFMEPLFIVSVLILIKFFFTGKEVVMSFHFIGITLNGHIDGLKEGLLIACRIISAVSVIAVLGFATPFTECVEALSWLRVPKSLLEISLFAYRYIFLLIEDAGVIYSAQKNRLGYSSAARGLGSFGTLAGSLTLRAFDNSQKIATAMEQRGYDGSLPMTAYKPFRSSEVILSALFLLVMAVIWKI